MEKLKSHTTSRRKFLKQSAAVIGSYAVGHISVRSYRRINEIRDAQSGPFNVQVHTNKYTHLLLDSPQGLSNLENVLTRPAPTDAKIATQCVTDNLIAFKESDNQRLSGNGYLLTEDGFILTALHVLQGLDKYWMRANNRRGSFLTVTQGSGKRRSYEVDTRILMTAPEHDIAIIKIFDEDGFDVKPYGLATQDVEARDGITTHSVYDDSLRSHSGKVIKKHIVLEDKNNEQGNPTIKDVFATDSYARPGYSGSSVLNSSGELAGILVGQEEGRIFGPKTFATPISYVRKMIVEACAYVKKEQAQHNL